MLEVIVIGAGRMGREHAHAISAAGDEVIAFLDPDLTRAESAAAEIGGEALAAEADLTGPLERLTRRGASAALIASPSVLHLAHAQAAISLGLPVLLEKPPWVPGQDPEPLLAAARQGAVLAVGMTTRFNPGVQAVRNAVRSGALGPLLFASGGVLVTNGVHSLDRLGWILGETLVLRSVRLSSGLFRSCEDTALLELSADGATVQVTELWGPGPVPPSELLVIGPRGSCWTDSEGNWRLSSVEGSRSEDRPLGYSEILEQWRAFRDLVLEGRRSSVLPGIEELWAPMQLLEQAVHW